MTISLYQASVPPFMHSLKAAKAFLAKAAAHAEAHKIDPSVLLQMRLFPNMFPLVRQVQIATDFAKGSAARLAGIEPPKYEDRETTFAELQARLDKTLTYLEGFKPAQIDGQEERDISLQAGSRTLSFKGQPYLTGFVLPNFYFHLTTAYAILRHSGVELGKGDFLGLG
jgi:hypothetical protein